MQPNNDSNIATLNQSGLQTQTSTRLTVHVVQHLAPGGIESLVLSMLNHLKPNEQALVVSLEGDRYSSINAWSKLANYQQQLIFLNKPQGLSTTAVTQLSRLFRILKPNVVHTHHIGPLLYAGCAARLAKVESIVHTEHDCWHLDNPKHLRLQKLALSVVKPRVVADADAVMQQLHRKLNYADITVIKNGVDCQRFKPAAQSLARQKIKLPTEGVIVGCAGRLEYVKGQDVLIRSLPHLDKDISVAFAGKGSQLSRLKTLAKTLGVEERIHWLGLVDDMPRFYQALDLFCLPSRHEGFPLSTLEAQACDVPVVACDVGAVKETLCRETGRLSRADDPSDLAKQIMTSLTSDMSTSPRQFVIDNNNLEQMVHAYRTIAMEVK